MQRMVEVEGELVDNTPMAWLFTDDGSVKNAVWLPKSLVTWTPKEEDSVDGTMEMPEWLAEREGLI